MPYVKRDGDGKIIAVFADSTENGVEEVAADDPALIEFLNSSSNGAAQLKSSEALEAKQNLAVSDQGMVRVLDDLINLLIEKGLIKITDLPEAAQQKLIERGGLRNRFGYLGGMLLDEESEEFIAPEIKDFL